jgi:hypothetical protein
VIFSALSWIDNVLDGKTSSRQSLRISNTPGPADIRFDFGEREKASLPFAGHWQKPLGSVLCTPGKGAASQRVAEGGARTRTAPDD